MPADAPSPAVTRRTAIAGALAAATPLGFPPTLLPGPAQS